MYANLFLCLVLAVSFVKTEIPSYIHVCGRKDPNIEKCVINSIEQLRVKLRNGIPELEVPPAEPLHLKALKLIDLPNLQADAIDLKLYGLLNYTVNHFKFDFEDQKLFIDLSFDKLKADALYNVSGKLLVEIQDKGPVHLDVSNIAAKVTMAFQLVQRKGKSYMYFSSMTTKITIGDFKANFTSANGESNDTITAAVNSALINSHKEILESTTPHIEKVISEYIVSVGNKIVKHFTFDELFPDRE